MIYGIHLPYGKQNQSNQRGITTKIHENNRNPIPTKSRCVSYLPPLKGIQILQSFHLPKPWGVLFPYMKKRRCSIAWLSTKKFTPIWLNQGTNSHNTRKMFQFFLQDSRKKETPIQYAIFWHLVEKCRNYHKPAIFYYKCKPVICPVFLCRKFGGKYLCFFQLCGILIKIVMFCLSG